MSFEELVKKWKSFVLYLNDTGLPLPMIRDPKTKTASVTLTLVVMAATLCGISILFMLGSAVAKLTGFLVLNVETVAQIKTGFDCSFQFLIAALSTYTARKFQRDSKGSLTVEEEDKSSKQ